MQLRSFWNPCCWGLGNFISLVITSNILYCSIFSNTFNKHDDKDTSRKLSGEFFLSYCLLCIWVRLYLFSIIGIFVNNEYSKYDVNLLHVYRTAHIKPKRWRSYSIICKRSSGNHTFLPKNNCCPLTPVMKNTLKRDHTLQWHLYHILVDHMPSAYNVDVFKTRLFV